MRSRNHQHEAATTTGPEHTPMRSWALVAVLMVVVAVAVSAIHWPALSARVLSLDDEQYLIENRLVKNPSWTAAWRFLTEVLEPSTVQGYYQPLTMISLMLDVIMGGRDDNLYVFHRTSLALHVLNTMLMIALLYALFGQPWPAALAGLLFGVHPMTVEQIPWLCERKTLLAACFGLGCLILYVRYTRVHAKWPFLGSLLCYLLALMSKPTSMPLPVVLFLLDYWPLRRLNKRSIIEKLPFLVVGIVLAVITVISQDRTASTVMPSEYTLTQWPLRVCYVVMFYLSKIAWPVHLSSVYPLPAPLALSNPVVVLSVLGICALLGTLVVSWRWTPALTVGWLIFFVVISPTLGFIGYSWISASNKYVYLPSTGLIVVLGWFLGWCWDGASTAIRLWFRRIGVTALVLILASAESIATRNYLARWQDTEGLYLYMLKLAPQAPVLHLGLGNALADRGELDDAVRHYREALQFNPSYPKAHANLALVLARQGKTDEAIAHCYEALRLEPDYPRVHNNVGNFLMRQGRIDEAMKHFAEAVRLNSDSARAHNNLGNILSIRGELDEAKKHFNEALSLDPDYAKAHSNLAGIFLTQGEVDEAIAHYREAVRLEPGLVEARCGLAAALVRQGSISESIEHYNEALRRQPDSVTLLNELAWVLATHDVAPPEGVEAIKLAERACKKNGYRQAVLLDTLAAAYADAGRYTDAVITAKQALTLTVSEGQSRLTKNIRERLRLYETGQPYRAKVEHMR